MEFEAFEKLSIEVGAWSRRNFEGNTTLEPVLGMAEEVGELTHAVLKRRQGIRHTPAECDAMERDAIGDIAIYAADAFSRVDDAGPSVDRSYRRLAALFHGIASILSNAGFGLWPSEIEELVSLLDSYCEGRGWSLEEIVGETWAKVGNRDWRANPMTAATEGGNGTNPICHDPATGA